MERYLLFDAGCQLCSSIAQDVEKVSDQLLKVASLRDAHIKALLDRSHPGWHFEPMIVEIDREQVQLFTGLALRWKILTLLGPQRTWRVVQIVRQAALPPTGYHPTRRHLLTKGGLAILGGITFGLGWGPLRNLQADAAILKTPAGLPNKATKLSSEELAQLKKHPVVQTVDQHFGSPSWNDGYRYEKSPEEKGYIIVYVPSQNEVGTKTMFVTIDDATPGKTYSIVGQLAQADQHSVAITWFTSDGQLLCTTMKDVQGKVTVTAPDSVTPNFNVGCFLGCVGSSLSTFCVSQCIACIGNILSCAVCTICAGPAGVSCARMCNF